jgi:OmpA-OmpF porin, OOP family
MNRYRFRGALLLAGAGLLSATSALAEEAGFYFGLTGGASIFDVPSKADLDTFFLGNLDRDLSQLTVPASIGFVEKTSVNDSDAAWGATVGYRWNSYVAAEVSYVNLGEARYEADLQIDNGSAAPLTRLETGTFESSGATLALLGMLPLSESFDLHVIGGVYFEDTRFNRPSAFEDELTGATVFGHKESRSSDKELFVGAGAAWNINPSYSVRVQYQRYFNVGSDQTLIESDVNLFTGSILFR